MTTKGESTRGSRRVGYGLLMLAVLALGPAACEQGTEPTPPGASTYQFQYVPAKDKLALLCGEHADLEVQGEGTGTVLWKSASGQSGRGIRFRAFSTRWLPDTVSVTVDTEGVAEHRQWILDPGPILTTEAFRPLGTDVTGTWRFPQGFSFESPCDAPPIAWRVDDEAAGEGTEFQFTPDRVGLYAVAAWITMPDLTLVRRWVLNVLGPGENLFYSPADPSPSIYETRNQYFSVAASVQLPEVVWHADGAPAGTGSTFIFAGETVGEHEITADVTVPDSVVSHTWLLEVLPVAAGRPDPVADITMLAGPRLGQTTMHWAAVPDAAFPVVEYEARVSLTGPVTADNWPHSLPLDQGTWNAGADRYHLTVWNHHEDWNTGDEVCLTVRARDSQGTLSDVVTNACLLIDNDWWIRGQVTGPDGVTPAPGVVVTDRAGGPSASTDAAGAFLAGPFKPEHTAQIELGGPVAGETTLTWTPWKAPDIHSENVFNLRATLLPAYGTDPSCYQFQETFSRYLRLMTNTVHTTSSRPNVNLYKWDSYPVDIHIPDMTSDTGIDYGAAARHAVAIWNDTMGEDFLRLVDSPPQSGILFVFKIEGDTVNGRARLLQPGDGELHLSEAVPELVDIELRTDFPSVQRLTETCLHELGHCLGLYGHAYCNETGYIMNYSSSGALDNGPENAIHLDEQRALRMIRILPQGVDMSVYPMD